MIRLYGVGFDDPTYPALAERCTALVWDTALQVINSGQDVVLDWNCWSVARRHVWASRARTAGAQVRLHHLTADLSTAQQRSADRNACAPPHAHQLANEDIAHLAALFEPPQPFEGIETVRVP
ncbi:MAG: AAA family ATPase [Propionibacteriales bacterium]|nr:AAA family ATPase [Propionibacteriales bacterium]